MPGDDSSKPPLMLLQVGCASGLHSGPLWFATTLLARRMTEYRCTCLGHEQAAVDDLVRCGSVLPSRQSLLLLIHRSKVRALHGPPSIDHSSAEATRIALRDRSGIERHGGISSATGSRPSRQRAGTRACNVTRDQRTVRRRVEARERRVARCHRQRASAPLRRERRPLRLHHLRPLPDTWAWCSHGSISRRIRGPQPTVASKRGRARQVQLVLGLVRRERGREQS